MKNPFEKNPLTIHELNTWISNPLVNPRTGKPIKENNYIYKLILNSYNKLTEQLINCNEDRDPISMNLFWTEINGIRKVLYPLENINEIIFYIDNNQIMRGLEKETIRHLKIYNIKHHPVSMEPIPENILNLVELIECQSIKTLEDLALDVFQYFSKISIFIDYQSFLRLEKHKLIKFNFELRDFWFQNFDIQQRNNISNSPILSKTDSDLRNENVDNIKKYLLNQMEILLKCEIEEYKYMINYIILGALGIVIPEIREQYPDFVFAFEI